MNFNLTGHHLDIDRLAAGVVGGDDQQAVFIENGQAGVVESQEGGAVGFFHRGCGG